MRALERAIEPVELHVERHREDDHDADPHEELVRADPDQRQPGLEDADQDGADEGADDRPAPACERGAADHAGTDGVEDVVDAEVARVEGPVLGRVDDPDEAGEEGAEHEAPHLHAPDRHARLRRPDQVPSRGDDPDTETRAREHQVRDDHDRQHPEDLRPDPDSHQLAPEARPVRQRDRRCLRLIRVDEHQPEEDEVRRERRDEGRHVQAHGDQPVHRPDTAAHDERDQDRQPDRHSEIVEPVLDPRSEQEHLTGRQVDLPEHEQQHLSDRDPCDRPRVAGGRAEAELGGERRPRPDREVHEQARRDQERRQLALGEEEP